LTRESLRFARPDRSFVTDDMPPLESLWAWPREFLTDADLLARLRGQALSVVIFVGREFRAGRIASLTRALGTARSVPEMIEQGLDMPFEQFEREWRAWLAR
jgi:hypothetical protein